MKRWTFYDYADSAGVNVIEQWLHTLPMDARLEINTRISYLETVTALQMPYARMLKRECDGLLELRIKKNNIQYRPIACYGKERHTVILLFGAIEKGGKFEPLSACDTALRRKTEIIQPGRIHEHSCAEPKSTR
jgi:hypothetical protein